MHIVCRKSRPPKQPGDDAADPAARANYRSWRRFGVAWEDLGLVWLLVH